MVMRMHLKNVLWTTDLSDFSIGTVQYGINLAKLYNARLYLCHVVHLPPVTYFYGGVYVASEEKENRSIDYAKEQFESLMRGKDVDWVPLAGSGDIADEISRIVREKDIDLVISATHCRTGLRRLLLGSVTERLMRTLSCPLMVLRGPRAADETPFSASVRFEKIMIGCDFSPDATLAFEYGMSLAQEFQSEVHLVHVMEPPVHIDLERSLMAPDESLGRELKTHLTDRLTAMVGADACHWCTPKVTVLEGSPDEGLTRHAMKNRIDLIVMGLRGRSLVGDLIIGSTTDRVVRRAPCPVMSVCAKTLKT
jgi:nucleotide-binding universal stress UspA family protein